MGKIVICGLDQAGKSSIIKALKEGDFVQTDRTIGFDADVLQIKNLKINILDLGGQKAFRSGWPMHFNNLSALVWVVDSSAQERFHEVLTEFDNIKDLVPQNGIILVLANKQDLAETDNVEEIQRLLRLEFLVQKWYIIGTSTQTNEGLRDGFIWLYENLTNEQFSSKKTTSYNIPIDHLYDGQFNCLFLEAGECPYPDSIPESCKTCEFGSCKNCLNQNPECLSLFPDYFKSEDTIGD